MRPIDILMEKDPPGSFSKDQEASRSLLHDVMTMAMVNMIQERNAGVSAPAPMSSGLFTGARDPRLMMLTPEELKVYRAEQEGQRDKMTLASVVFCSPLMLLGMGATMAIMDDMRITNESKFEKSMSNRTQLRSFSAMAEAQAANERAAAMKALSAAMEPLITRPVLDRKPPVDSSGEKKNHNFVSAPRQARVLTAPEKRGLKASNLVKAKQKLSDELEKNRGQMSLADVSAVVSAIEQLDKELKKMGC